MAKTKFAFGESSMNLLARTVQESCGHAEEKEKRDNINNLSTLIWETKQKVVINKTKQKVVINKIKIAFGL